MNGGSQISIPVEVQPDTGGGDWLTPIHVKHRNLNHNRRIISHHTVFNFGLWNNLRLYRPGALKLLLNQLDIYRIDTAAVQEIRWTGGGMLAPKRNHTIYYSCCERYHQCGTGFIAGKRFK